MLTIEKLLIYYNYRGDYDGYYLSNKNSNLDRITGEEWYLLKDLIHDLFLIRTSQADKEYEFETNRKLRDYCENESVIEKIKEIEIGMNCSLFKDRNM